MSSFWDKRYEVHGHTGWSDSFLYQYDQRARLNVIEDKISDLKFNSFLDLGCGSGDFTQLCLNKKNYTSGLGVDISQKAINALKDKFNSSGRVDFKRIDLTEDALPSQEFDLVICITVLQHLGDDQKIIAAIRNIKSSMKPDGHLLVLENIYGTVNAHNNSYIRTNISSEKWKSLLKAGGIEITDVSTYSHWGVVLTESVQFLSAKIRRRKFKSIKGLRDVTSVSKVDSKLGFKTILRRLVLAVAYVLDNVLKIPIPKAWRRYEIFKCTI